MKTSQKIGAFSLPIFMGGMATGSGMLWEAIGANHPVLLIPIAVMTIATATVGAVSLIAKTLVLMEGGWEKIAGECHVCKRLKAENNALLDAIK